VIRMQQNFSDVISLFPRVLDVEELLKISAIEPFSDEVVLFLNALSQELTKSSNIRSYPDVATFAFFCRKANILNIKKRSIKDDSFRLGRGIAFHIAPSNVPVNFAYSLVCGMLSGNVNVVRVPSKDFDQVKIICETISNLAQNNLYRNITSRIALVRYDKNSSATSLFSSKCDVRIIWGGDETIAQIRKNNIPARAFDVTFADRYSICAINAEKYLVESNKEAVALGFYNDTYLFDQNACTAPHLIVWLGSNEKVETAKSIFWDKLHELVLKKYGQLQSVIAVDKLTALYNQAIKNDDIHQIPTEDNLLWRIKIDTLTSQIEEYRCSSGYFSEYNANSLFELTKIINRKYQTLAYYGLSKNELTNFVKTTNLIGIDRIVPIGHTADFSVIWDGFDLLNTLTRIIDINFSGK